jgi:hypothetical protein
MKSKKMIVQVPGDIDELIVRYQNAYRIVKGKHAPTKPDVLAMGIDKVNLERIVSHYEREAELKQQHEVKLGPGRPRE